MDAEGVAPVMCTEAFTIEVGTIAMLVVTSVTFQWKISLLLVVFF
jgi:hypothetical protein